LQKFAFAVLLVLVSVVVLHRVPDAGLVWDDTKNDVITQPIDAASGARAEMGSLWKLRSGEPFTPVAPTLWTTLKVLKGGAALSPRTLHTLSLATHAASAIVVFLILALVTQTHGAAFVGALVFALHPLQVEPVAYVSAYPHVLGAFFAFVAIWQYLAYLTGSDSYRKRKTINHYYVATLAFVLALLTSPAMVVAPFVAWILRRFLPKRNSLIAPRAAPWPLAAWSVLAIPVAVWAMMSQNTAALADQMPFWAKPVVAADALSFYLSKIFAPALIGPDYGRSPGFLLGNWWAYATWILPATLALALAYWNSKARAWYSTAYMLLAVGLLPALGFVLFETQATSTVANRYAYFSMIGPALAAAYTMSMPRRAWMPAVVVAYCAVFAWLARKDSGHWVGDAELWSHAVQVNPSSPMAHQTLGDEFRRRGDWQNARLHFQKVLEVNAVSADIHYYLGEIEREHGDPKKAMEFYKKTIEIEPAFAEAWARLGLGYVQAGDEEAARTHLEKAVELAPESGEPLRYLGLLHVRKAEYVDAIPFLTKGLRLSEHEDPGVRAEIHALLGLAFVRTGQEDAAQGHIEQALKLAPNNLEAHRILGDIYFGQGRFADARPHYEEALMATPDDATLLRNLGTILAAAKEHGKAVQHFQKALAAEPNSPETVAALGVAYFRLRQFKEAEESLRKALELKPALADPHYYLGDIARWQGNDETARSEYYRALKLDPTHPEANYRLGTYFMKNDQPTRAAAHFQAALKAAPEDQRLIYALKQAEQAKSGG
jgi:tetratricopeptide (TPR) repeat protein